MEANKRKAENGEFGLKMGIFGWTCFSPLPPGTNGTHGDKKARLDPTCGTLVFCGATDFANMLKPGKLKEVGIFKNSLRISISLAFNRSPTTPSTMCTSRCFLPL